MVDSVFLLRPYLSNSHTSSFPIHFEFLLSYLPIASIVPFKAPFRIHSHRIPNCFQLSSLTLFYQFFLSSLPIACQSPHSLPQVQSFWWGFVLLFSMVCSERSYGITLALVGIPKSLLKLISFTSKIKYRKITSN